MSDVLIQQYLNELQDLRKVSGTSRESVVREAFKDLLKGWGRSKDLIFVPEYEIESPAKRRRYVDGALLHELRVPFGYWEAKDEKDDLDAEIAHKFKEGYPQDNILFEDSREAVLIQSGHVAMRCAVDNVRELSHMLDVFFGHERPEIADFGKAVEQFTLDLPAILVSLRDMIEKATRENAAFRQASKEFLEHAQEAINPALTVADVREMLIQHVLTEEIFSKVFGEDDFHRENNVAKKLYELEATFFTGDLKKRTLKGLDAYYAAIRAAAAKIPSHAEKQTFLKVIYENFYKVYDRKAADRLGVVYTPNEIVRFMVESADWLCDRHFGKNLIDKDVEILDPATGTGTFICELIEHFRGQPKKLEHKYKEELHANEVAILPYYVANLNIEATYAAIMGKYEEFPNLCFVDTLDNVAALRAIKGHAAELFGALSDENMARIKRQNARKISVIIGNPPYNANQQSENENYKNREYPEIDKRIKTTYIAASTAQKTKLYDMYARFFRWASDRLGENGILAFVTNRSFIDSRTFDGFRKVVAEEFSEIWVVDLGGDWKKPGVSGGGNVFGIGTGVAISFMIKKQKHLGCRIQYICRGPLDSQEEKLAFLGSCRLRAMPTEVISPDKQNNWIGIVDNDFDSNLPIATRATKSSQRSMQEAAIFKLYSLGVVTNRDDWVYDFSREAVGNKVSELISVYDRERNRGKCRNARGEGSGPIDMSIKWTRAVKADLVKGIAYAFDPKQIVECLYRPFVRKWLYFDRHLNEMQYQMPSIFPKGIGENYLLALNDRGARSSFSVLATKMLPELHLCATTDGFQGFPMYVYNDDGTRHENITYWALEQFRDHYQPKEAKPARSITREDIFQYVYGVLHDPVYREKYALNLKREFPRIPFYADFWQWADWGKDLMDLHLGYESVAPFALSRADIPDEKARRAGLSPKVLLRADKTNGFITLDTETTLGDVPPDAWRYVLGNRSALEWVLDQHKEKKPKDPTIREKFNTYRFADYKEKVVDLLMRVTTVSVRTVAITDAMRKAVR